MPPYHFDEEGLLMRSLRDLFNKAHIWSMVTNRYWERDMGGTDIPYQAPAMLEHYSAFDVLESYENTLLLTPSGHLGDSDLNQASWFSEPLSMLLWALNLIDFPEQSDGVGLSLSNTIYDHEFASISQRTEDEIRDALSSQFWIFRRVHSFLSGVEELDLESWMSRSGQSPSLIKLCKGDLKMYDERPISEWKISDLPYDVEYIKISRSRLKALIWICSEMGYEDLDPQAGGIDLLPLKDIVSVGFTQWNHAGQVRCLDRIRAGAVDDAEFKAWLRDGSTKDLRDLDGETPLLAAVRADQEGMVHTLLQAGANLELAHPNGFSPLHMAIRKGCSVKLIKCLLDAGADVESTRNVTSYPLYTAIESGRTDLADLLMEYGAGVDGARQTDPPVFATLGETADLSMLRYILDKGADLNEVNYHTQSPLIASLEGYGNSQDSLFLEAAKELIERGASLDLFDGDGYYPIHHAVLNGALEIVQLILKKGFDINKAPRGLSPLWMATAGQQDDVALYLLEQGADTEVPTEIGGETPLFAAVNKSGAEVVKALLESGAEINHISKNGRTALMLAVQYGKVEAFEEFMKREVDVNVRDKEGQSALYFATNGGMIEMFEKLLQKGATLEHSAQNKGYTLLHTACNSSLGGPMIPRLLELGLDPTSRDDNGHTPLHLFLFDEDPMEMTKLLVEAGAPIDAENNQGQSIRDFAERNGHQEVLEWLERWRLQSLASDGQS